MTRLWLTATLPVSPPDPCPECGRDLYRRSAECSACGIELCGECIQSDPRFEGEVCPACLRENDEWGEAAVDFIQALVDIVAGIDGPESLGDIMGRIG